MESLKKIVEASPEKANKGAFLELCPKNDKGIPTSNGVHKVKLLRGEPATNKDYKTQKDVDGVNLFFEENGVEKSYFVPELVNDKNSDKFGKFHYLFERFADIPEGSVLEIEFVKRGMKGFVDVRTGTPTIQEDEIPVIEDGSDIDPKDIPF